MKTEVSEPEVDDSSGGREASIRPLRRSRAASVDVPADRRVGVLRRDFFIAGSMDLRPDHGIRVAAVGPMRTGGASAIRPVRSRAGAPRRPADLRARRMSAGTPSRCGGPSSPAAAVTVLLGLLGGLDRTRKSSPCPSIPFRRRRRRTTAVVARAAPYPGSSTSTLPGYAIAGDPARRFTGWPYQSPARGQRRAWGRSRPQLAGSPHPRPRALDHQRGVDQRIVVGETTWPHRRSS